MSITTQQWAQQEFADVHSTNPTALAVAWAAADEWVSDRTTWPGITDTPPKDPPKQLVQAVRLLTARQLARLNSPDGTVGLSELGAVRVPRTDPDVWSMIAGYRRVVWA